MSKEFSPFMACASALPEPFVESGLPASEEAALPFSLSSLPLPLPPLPASPPSSLFSSWLLYSLLSPNSALWALGEGPPAPLPMLLLPRPSPLFLLLCGPTFPAEEEDEEGKLQTMEMVMRLATS